MKQRFRMYQRGLNGRFYLQDNTTGKQESRGTSDKTETLRLLHARNEAAYQLALNAQMARAYPFAGDAQIGQRLAVRHGRVEAGQGFAWAGRAREAGYPERYAQEAFGHTSAAVHRAYAKGAKVNIPSLDEYERRERATEPPAVAP